MLRLNGLLLSYNSFTEIKDWSFIAGNIELEVFAKLLANKQL